MSYQPASHLIINLDQATSDKRLALSGTFFKISNASSINAMASISFDSTTSPREYKRGSGFRNMPYSHCYVSWEAQAGEWIEITTHGNPKSLPLDAQYDTFNEVSAAEVNIASHSLLDTSPVPVTSVGDEIEIGAGESIVAMAARCISQVTYVILEDPSDGVDYVVGSGKKFITDGISGSTWSNNILWLEVIDNAETHILHRFHIAGYQVNHHGFKGLVIPEGYKFRMINVGSNSATTVNVWGREVDA